MTRPSRLRAVTLGVVAVAAVATTALVAGCDDSSPASGGGTPIAATAAPAAATVQSFCDAYDLGRGLSPDADDDELAATLHSQAAKLAEVGTPDDIPREGRSGFVVYVAAVSGVSGEEARSLVGDPTADTYASALGLSDDERPDLAAFLDYLAGTCFG